MVFPFPFSIIIHYQYIKVWKKMNFQTAPEGTVAYKPDETCEEDEEVISR